MTFLSELNQRFFYAINGLALDMLDPVMILATRMGDSLNVAALIMLLVAYTRARKAWPNGSLLSRGPSVERSRDFLKVLLLAALGTTILVSLLKWGLQLPRPSVILPEGTVRVVVPPDTRYSFPSGHAAFSMMLAWLIWPQFRLTGRCVLVFFIVLIGVSRLYLGVHFPIDVMTGWLCGALSAWGSRWWFAEKRRSVR